MKIVPIIMSKSFVSNFCMHVRTYVFELLFLMIATSEYYCHQNCLRFKCTSSIFRKLIQYVAVNHNYIYFLTFSTHQDILLSPVVLSPNSKIQFRYNRFIPNKNITQEIYFGCSKKKTSENSIENFNHWTTLTLFFNSFCLFADTL